MVMMSARLKGSSVTRSRQLLPLIFSSWKGRHGERQGVEESGREWEGGERGTAALHDNVWLTAGSCALTTNTNTSHPRPPEAAAAPL